MTRWLSGVAIALCLSACAQAPETRLTVEATPQAGDTVEVTGETALPDGAQLNVSLLKEAGEEPLVVSLPVVKDARYSAVLDPKADLPAGSYRVRVEFSPQAFAWSDQVKPAVGERGEKLGGPHVTTDEDGIRILRIDRQVTLP